MDNKSFMNDAEFQQVKNDVVKEVKEQVVSDQKKRQQESEKDPAYQHRQFQENVRQIAEKSRIVKKS